MGLVAYIIDHKQVMAELPEPPIIINDLNLDLGTKEGRDQLMMYLACTFESDVIPAIPSCLGGHIKGEGALGEKCPICHTRVENLVDRAMSTGVWIAPPEGVLGFIHPEIWNVLSPRLTPLKSFSVLQWICDPNSRETLPAYQAVLDQYTREHRRGINYFIENFDAVIAFVMNSKLCSKLSQPDRADILQFLEENRDKVFQPHLALPSQIFAVSEKTAMGKYADEKTPELLDAVFTITSTISSPLKLTQRMRESRTARAVAMLASTFQTICTKFIGGKYGLVRRQWIGSRLHWTGRAVVTSINDPHHYEEVHVPWAFATQLLEYQLINKLLRRGMSVNDALAFLEDNTLQWNPLLRELFDRLIDEAPPLTGFPEGIFIDIDEDPSVLKGIPNLLQRNPSLTRLSAQNLRLKVKDDVDDYTISVSDHILVQWNCDFDGDYNRSPNLSN